MTQASEPVMLEISPDGDIVDGDASLTTACMLVVTKLRTPVLLVEATPRSFDHAIGEAIDRAVTSMVCSLIVASKPGGATDLVRE